MQMGGASGEGITGFLPELQIRIKGRVFSSATVSVKVGLTRFSSTQGPRHFCSSSKQSI
jgi:hypothetical protein